MDTNHNKNKNTSKRHKKHKYTKDLQRDISNDEDTKLPEIDKKKKKTQASACNEQAKISVCKILQKTQNHVKAAHIYLNKYKMTMKQLSTLLRRQK